MRIPSALRSARALATPAIVRRGALVTALALIERLLTPAAAWSLFSQPIETKVLVAIALGAVFTTRGLVERVFMAQTQADLLDRVIRGVLHGDVLRTSVLADVDAHTELGQAAYHASRQLAQELPVLLADIVACTVLVGIVVILEPLRLVLVALALMILGGAALAWSRSRVQHALSDAWSLQRQVVDHLVDALEGRLELVALGLRDAFLQESNLRTRSWGAAGARVAVATAVLGRLPIVGIAGAVAAVVAADARWRSTLAVTLADLALLAAVTPALAGVAQGVQNTVRAERWVSLVVRVARPSALPFSGQRETPVLPASLAFDCVTFRYEHAAGDALTAVSFDWEGIGLLALVGANGSGKSTCLRLLLALARPQSGAIRIGGTDLWELDADVWRARVGFLPQRPYLPQRSTTRAAIRLLAPEASDDRMSQALDRVGLLPILRRMSKDPLEVRVDALSVGQRQRVALARFLCRDATLLLLDEPEANLDAEGVTTVAALVRELARDKIVIVAAHSTELVEIADRRIELAQGRVVRDEAPRSRARGRVV